jgi:hypothetical protein
MVIASLARRPAFVALLRLVRAMSRHRALAFRRRIDA